MIYKYVAGQDQRKDETIDHVGSNVVFLCFKLLPILIVTISQTDIQLKLQKLK